MKKKLLLFFFFLSIAFWVSHTNQRTDYWCRDMHFEEYQNGVMNHTIYGPIAYRVMIPYTVDFLSNICHVGSEKQVVFYLNIFLLLLTQFAFYYYLKNIFSDTESLLGTLWLDLCIMMGFTSFIGIHVYETMDVCNLFFMSCALNLLYNHRWRWLIIILFFGMLNRETPAFLLLPVYIFLYKKKISIRWALLCTIAVLIPYFSLKLLIHPPQPFWFQTIYLSENLPFLKDSDPEIIGLGYLKFILLLGSALWIALSGFKNKNEFFRITMLIVPVYIPIHLIVGHLEEYRLWIPLFLFLIPLGLETIRSFKENGIKN